LAKLPLSTQRGRKGRRFDRRLTGPSQSVVSAKPSDALLTRLNSGRPNSLMRHVVPDLLFPGAHSRGNNWDRDGRPGGSSESSLPPFTLIWRLRFGETIGR